MNHQRLFSWISPLIGLATVLSTAGGTVYPEVSHAAAPMHVHRLTLMATQDSMTSTAAKQQNFGASRQLELGSTSSDQRQALLQFDLGSLPRDATIVGAQVQLFQHAAAGNPPQLSIRADDVGGRWSEQTVTRAAQPPSLKRDDRVTALDAVAGWKTWNITTLARRWATNPATNMGVLLQPLNAPTPSVRSFSSRDDEHNTLNAPRLVVEYSVPRATITLNDMPLSIQRRATQFLEEMRGTSIAPRWLNAQLGNGVQPLYRPDLTTVAYYEVPVVVPTRGGAQQAGWITLSAGEYDLPIAHWNDQGESPTQELQRRASAIGSTLQRFYKLDTLSYAAEDTAGNLVANPGAIPPEIVGQDPASLKTTPVLAESRWSTTSMTTSDANTAHLTGKLTRSGPAPSAALQLRPWASWQALKTGYTKSYETQITALQGRASPDWALELEAQRWGEGLERGETYRLALLQSTAPRVQLEGAGARYVSTALQTAGTQAAVLQIVVTGALADQDLPFTVVITYANRRIERVPFVIASDNAISKARQSDAASGEGSAPKASIAPQAASASSSWTPWTYYFAGSDEDQRLYSQIPSGSAPNTSGCWSGCGATAWAMLFGWADNQAAQGNSYWAKRSGLYRQNGGYGADAVAPRFMDSGIRNITWEIRNYIGTFCAFGSGATLPWKMDEAWRYLSGRSGTRIDTHYNVFGWSESRLRRYARNAIRDRGTPAIIGTGWLHHYPLADAYMERSRKKKVCALGVCFWSYTQHQRNFFANQGHGGSGNGWIEADTWFAGEIYPD